MNLKYSILTICFFIVSIPSVMGQVKFDFTADEHDFGVSEEGLILIHSFEFTNGGKDTIHLKEETRDVRPGCGCTTSDYTKEPIPPGGKGFVKAAYNSTGRIGSYNKTITVSQKGTPYKILTIKGIVVKKDEKSVLNPNAKKLPILSIDKKAHQFGKLEKGKNGNVKFTLKNSGKDTLKILSSSSACNCVKYKLINPKDNLEQKYLLPGKTVLLDLNYLPAAPVGFSDSKTKDIFTIFTNDPKNSKIELSLQSEIIETIQNK